MDAILPLAAASPETLAKPLAKTKGTNGQKLFSSAEVATSAPAPDRAARLADMTLRSFDNTVTEIEYGYHAPGRYSEDIKDLMNKNTYSEGIKGMTERAIDINEVGLKAIYAASHAVAKSGEFQIHLTTAKKYGDTLNMFLRGS